MKNRSAPNHWIIGSDFDCDLVIVNDQIAKQHALLVRKDSTWLIQPLDGGLKLDGKPLSGATQVVPTDDIRLVDDVPLPWPSKDGALRVLTIGRSPQCDIVLNAPNVSGHHATLYVGHRGTFVLEDANSTNGLFHESHPSERLKRLVIEPSMSVFFGANVVLAADLIATAKDCQAQAPLETSKAHPKVANFDLQVEPKQSQRPVTGDQAASASIREYKKTSLSLTPWAISLITIPLMLGLFFAFKQNAAPEREVDQIRRDDSLIAESIDVTPSDPVPSASQRPTPPAQRSIETTPQSSIAANVDSVPTIASVSTEPPAVATKVADHEDAIFWIVIQKKADKTSFRIGTGVAISSRSILTTGTIILASDQLRKSMNGIVQLVHLKTAKRLPLAATRVHPELTKQLLISQQIKKQLADLSNRSDKKPDDSAEIDRLSNLMNLALQSASAVDVGWIETESIESPLTLASDLTLRPNQQATAILSGFQIDDPFFDPAEERPISMETVKIKSFGPAVDDNPGVVRIAATKLPRENNFFGCPLLISGKLAGIISYSGSDPDSDEMLIESVSPQVINRFIQDIDSSRHSANGTLP